MNLGHLGTWGKPVDSVGWSALVLGAWLLAASPAPALLGPGRDLLFGTGKGARFRFLGLAGFLAAFLSLGYASIYLGGGPRSIDATTYFLQARALSEGDFSWAVPDPSSSFRGRFLLFSEPHRLAGIFPPGYPLLLSFGIVLGAPLLVGCVVASFLAIATYQLAVELAHSIGFSRNDTNPDLVGRLAAGFSVLSSALRYHTADTMSHAASALGITLALVCLAFSLRENSRAHCTLAGLCTGFVLATRPISALSLVLLGTVFCGRGASVKGGRAGFLLGLLPGAVLLALAYKATTGSFWTPTQLSYYATSDGPLGCFRMGFGRDIGCEIEHGDFLAKYMPQGFGVGAAVQTTLRRLSLHLGDSTNLPPLTLLLGFLGARLVRTSSAIRLALGVVLFHILAYLPFYFDGNYPGAGARFYADVLPVEHALFAVGLSAAFAKIPFSARALTALACSLLGFAVHTGADHRALSASWGGRPMFEREVLQSYGAVHGIVFFDTDHGFNLAYRPGVDPKREVLAVRQRGDDRDRLVYEMLGKPTSRKYVFDAAGQTAPRVDIFVPPPPSPVGWRFEAENEWPFLRQTSAWGRPRGERTASGGRMVEVILAPGKSVGEIELDLPVVPSRSFLLRPSAFLLGHAGRGRLSIIDGVSRTPLADWTWNDDGPAGFTVPLEAKLVQVSSGSARAVVEAKGANVGIDAFLEEERGAAR